MTLRETAGECRPKRDVLERPDYTEAEVQALRAIEAGNATERQQQMVIRFLMRVTGLQDISYRPKDVEATAFAEGKRWVGSTLLWLLSAAPTRTDSDKIAVRNVKEEQR